MLTPPRHSFLNPNADRGSFVSSHSRQASWQGTQPPHPSGKGTGKGAQGKGGNRRQSAPRAFGTNDHGAGLAAGGDLPEGDVYARVDKDEGMVYELAAAAAGKAAAASRTSPSSGEDGGGGGGGGGDETGKRAACVYFCDRFRRYRFTCPVGGLHLLKGLVAVNKVLLAENAKLFEGLPQNEVSRLKAQGYALYEEKPTLQKSHHANGAKAVGTWSDEEYALPGFQWMYLRYKSYQRFAETWALLERCAAAGLFQTGAPLCAFTGIGTTTSSLSDVAAVAVPADQGGKQSEEEGAESKPSKLRVVSLGGGPGFELLAFDWFARMEMAVPSSGASSGSCRGGESSVGESGAWRALRGARERWLSERFSDVERQVALAAGAGGAGAAGTEVPSTRGGVGPGAAVWAGPQPLLDLVSLDLQPGWRGYVEALGYSFGQWDVHSPDAASAIFGGSHLPRKVAGDGDRVFGGQQPPEETSRGQGGSGQHRQQDESAAGSAAAKAVGSELARAVGAAAKEASEESGGGGVVCMLSNILCYCSDDSTADLFTELLQPGGGARCILVNERGAEQRMVSLLERRGIVVVKLLDQVAQGRDDRQMVFLPPGSPWKAAHGTLPNLPFSREAFCEMIFPNQPYEEKKYR